VLEFGKIVKKAVEKQGMLGWQYNTVGVSDAITMGGEGELTCIPFPAVTG
jgi:dihydroxy-acid dehydratase